MQEQEWQSYVDEAFNRMDLDGDGFIDLDELLRWAFWQAVYTLLSGVGARVGPHMWCMTCN